MKYRNVITGIEFESKCAISGEHFEVVGQKKTESTETKTEKPKTTTTKRSKK